MYLPTKPGPNTRHDIPTPLDSTSTRRAGRRRAAQVAHRSTADEDAAARAAVARAVAEANARLAQVLDPAEVAALGGGLP